MKNIQLDVEEKKILHDLDSGLYSPMPDMEVFGASLQASAKESNKSKLISIRLPEKEILRLKARASEEGLPYQTLIRSILYKSVRSMVS